MAQVTARATATVQAPPEQVLERLRDYDARPELLTDNYTACRVEAGGSGAGTIFAYHFAAGGRERDYRLRADEEPGILRERDELSSFVSTWTVEPLGPGTSSRVTLEGSWQGAGGVAGIFEGLFAPLGLRRIYAEVLANLAGAFSG
jgi:hypothetical protein